MRWYSLLAVAFLVVAVVRRWYSLLAFAAVCWIGFFYIMRARLEILLLETTDAFNKAGVDYWVDFGTLLGITRENGVILYDNDIDKMEEVKRILKSQNSALIIKREENWPAYRARRPLDIAVADLYINTTDGKMFRGAEGPKTDIPCALIGAPTTMIWRGREIKVPQYVHETLVYRYGDDYMVPKQGFKGRGA
jgi:hypothetical protein